jgi:pimeloyl-ACP methyl ester carboxylesterase
MSGVGNWFAVVVGHALGEAIAPWGEHQERLILRAGRPLSASEYALAAELGVIHPERVRVLHVDPVPVPVPQAWISIARRWGLPVFAPGGMTLGYGIFAAAESMDLIRHELVHVAQFERLGGIAPFLKRYFFECLTVGYANAPLELEAR